MAFDDFDDFFESGTSSKKPAKKNYGKRPGKQNVTHQVDVYEDNTNMGSYEEDVYVIRNITEVPLGGYSSLMKTIKGVPMWANNQYNLSLVHVGNIGHGGGVVNAVIYGKIEYVAIGPQMRVRIRGKYKHGLLVISHIYDADSGQEIYINRLYRNPADDMYRNRPRSHMTPLLIGLLLIGLVVGLIASLIGGASAQSLDTLKMVGLVIGALIFMKLFNINPFNNPTVSLILFLVVLIAIAIYVPGGAQIMEAVIILYIMYYLLKQIMK